jgi:transposase-like protein
MKKATSTGGFWTFWQDCPYCGETHDYEDKTIDKGERQKCNSCGKTFLLNEQSISDL